MFETAQATFGQRRRTTGPNQLDPLPRKKGGFLRKGEGNGGSPTGFVVTQQTDQNGHVILQPIAKRQGAISHVRQRDRSGGYTYAKGSIAQPSDRNEDLSPNQKQEMERKQRI